MPGSSVHGILQARILEWVAISSSRGSSWPRNPTRVSCIGRQILYNCTTWETQRVVMRTIKCREKTAGNSGHSRKIKVKQPGVGRKGHNEHGLCFWRLWQGPYSSRMPQTSHTSVATGSRLKGQDLTRHTSQMDIWEDTGDSLGTILLPRSSTFSPYTAVHIGEGTERRVRPHERGETVSLGVWVLKLLLLSLKDDVWIIPYWQFSVALPHPHSTTISRNNSLKTRLYKNN